MTEQKQTLIRSSEDEQARWKQAAEKNSQSLTEFIKTALNEKATEILECPHPMDQRITYPWRVQCLRCGERLDQAPAQAS